MATDAIENLVATHAQRLGINPAEAIDNALAFADIVGVLENDGALVGKNPKSTAKGLYQFIDGSVEPALNRLTKYIPAERWMDDARKHKDANRLDWEQQTLMFLGDLLEKDGSDEFMERILRDGDIEATEQAYYKLHHTNPDEATMRRTKRILYGTDNKN